MRRPSNNALIGIASGVLLLAGAAWIAADVLTGERDQPAPDAAISAGERVESKQVLPAPGAAADQPAVGRDGDASPPRDDASIASLDGVTVGIDPGHNGGNGAHPAKIARMVNAGGFEKACDTVGTTALDGTTESALAFDLAQRVATRLRAGGATVVVTRNDDTGVGPCIDRRAKITSSADVAISLHADGNERAGARGFHVIVPAPARSHSPRIAAKSRALGERVRDALADVPGLVESTYVGTNGMVVRSDLGGLNLSHAPKVLVETGNMKNAEDMKVLGSDVGRDHLARAIVAGIVAWLDTHSATRTE